MASYNPNHLSADELTCPICFEDFAIQSSSERVPKLLMCLHTFCLGCVRSLVKSNNTVQCSICRTEHTDVHPRDLYDNYVIINYVRKQQEENDARFAQEQSEMLMRERQRESMHDQRQYQVNEDAELARKMQRFFDEGGDDPRNISEAVITCGTTVVQPAEVACTVVPAPAATVVLKKPSRPAPPPPTHCSSSTSPSTSTAPSSLPGSRGSSSSRLDEFVDTVESLDAAPSTSAQQPGPSRRYKSLYAPHPFISTRDAVALHNDLSYSKSKRSRYGSSSDEAEGDLETNPGEHLNQPRFSSLPSDESNEVETDELEYGEETDELDNDEETDELDNDEETDELDNEEVQDELENYEDDIADDPDSDSNSGPDDDELSMIENSVEVISVSDDSDLDQVSDPGSNNGILMLLPTENQASGSVMQVVTASNVAGASSSSASAHPRWNFNTYQTPDVLSSTTEDITGSEGDNSELMYPPVYARLAGIEDTSDDDNLQLETSDHDNIALSLSAANYDSDLELSFNTSDDVLEVDAAERNSSNDEAERDVNDDLDAYQDGSVDDDDTISTITINDSTGNGSTLELNNTLNSFQSNNKDIHFDNLLHD